MDIFFHICANFLIGGYFTTFSLILGSFHWFPFCFISAFAPYFSSFCLILNYLFLLGLIASFSRVPFIRFLIETASLSLILIICRIINQSSCLLQPVCSGYLDYHEYFVSFRFPQILFVFHLFYCYLFHLCQDTLFLFSSFLSKRQPLSTIRPFIGILSVFD